MSRVHAIDAHGDGAPACLAPGLRCVPTHEADDPFRAGMSTGEAP